MRLFRLIVGSVTGAALMYFLDPQAGKRRRALMRDQLVKLSNTASNQVDVIAENTANRAQGMAAETRNRFSTEEVPDETLVARVRSEMGRYVSHPGAVEVTSNAGIVTLSGNILAEEVQPFVSKVESIAGVERVENHLQAHQEPGNIPDLQGGKTRTDML